jgi:hypothetical protein
MHKRRVNACETENPTGTWNFGIEAAGGKTDTERDDVTWGGAQVWQGVEVESRLTESSLNSAGEKETNYEKVLGRGICCLLVVLGRYRMGYADHRRPTGRKYIYKYKCR